MGQCPVVKIKFDNEDGYALLDESAFDESKHSLFIEALETGKPSAGETAPAATTQSSPVKRPWNSKKTTCGEGLK